MDIPHTLTCILWYPGHSYLSSSIQEKKSVITQLSVINPFISFANKNYSNTISSYLSIYFCIYKPIFIGNIFWDTFKELIWREYCIRIDVQKEKHFVNYLLKYKWAPEINLYKQKIELGKCQQKKQKYILLYFSMTIQFWFYLFWLQCAFINWMVWLIW